MRPDLISFSLPALTCIELACFIVFQVHTFPQQRDLNIQWAGITKTYIYSKIYNEGVKGMYGIQLYSRETEYKIYNAMFIGYTHRVGIWD